MKWVDLPPIWLVGFLLIASGLPRGGAIIPWQSLAGRGLIFVGLVLMALAVVQMLRHKTTVIPHRQPDATVTTGVFGLTRNPIYLGDACVLAGVLLYWQTYLIGWLLVPAFVWVITIRFIKPEEARLQEKFGAAFDAYTKRVRRWL